MGIYSWVGPIQIVGAVPDDVYFNSWVLGTCTHEYMVYIQWKYSLEQTCYPYIAT